VWLVDTSVWIEHFRRANPDLAERLSEGLVLWHPAILGELACGNLKDRSEILAAFTALPLATLATDTEVLHFIEQKKLWGRGIGWIDAHLLTSALLSHARLWTLDKRLVQVADDLRLS
jgi:predicted nucleic acid-binding protein